MTRNEYQGNEHETQHYDVFFSYSRKDIQVALLIKTAIQSLGYTVFYDQDILEGDSNWRATIAKNIDNCSGIVFFRTHNSVASKWCQREVNIADEAEKRILPISYRCDQQSLPASEDLKFALQSLQTSFISESPTVAELKNELQTALERTVGSPRIKGNGLSLTEFIISAADCLSSRYTSFFEHICARKISADVGNDKISLRWRFSLGNEVADINIVLNKYSRRPDCFGNCYKKKDCKFYVQTGKEEYSIEAYLDFVNRRTKSRIYDLLEKLLECAIQNENENKWCGSQGIKYFFRKRILDNANVNDKNDFMAALLLLEEAGKFYDTVISALQNYLEFAYDVCEIFRNEYLVSSLLNSVEDGKEKCSKWIYNSEIKGHEKIHFYKSNSSHHIDENELGKYCSIAIRYPEAFRITLQKIEMECIVIRLFRYEGDKQVFQDVKFKYNELRTDSSEDDILKNRKAQIKKNLKAEIKEILEKACEKPFSKLPMEIHEKLRNFIKENSSLNWNVSQETSSDVLAIGEYRSKYGNDEDFVSFPQIRFSIHIKYSPNLEKIEFEQHIISSFREANEQELSNITGFKIGNNEAQNAESFFKDVSKQLKTIHENVYNNIYKALYGLDRDYLINWRKKNAVTKLLLDNKQSSYIEGNLNNERCWEYYLSPVIRMCRSIRVRKNEDDFPIMFSIHFTSLGAKKATVGWYADHGFNILAPREKSLFWRYVLSQFPAEVKELFTTRNNEIILADILDEAKDIGERKPRFFQEVKDVEELLVTWLEERADGNGSMMEQMFAIIEKAIKDFNI